MATSVAEACCCSLRKSACTLAGHTAGRPWAGHAILVKHDHGLGCATCVHGGPPGHGERLARAREASRVGWVREHGNLVVLRTFSKSAGLAGLRVGWGAFPLAVIGFLWRAKQPYNVGVAAETAACAALENPGYLQARPQGCRAGARDPMAAWAVSCSYRPPHMSRFCDRAPGRAGATARHPLWRTGQRSVETAHREQVARSVARGWWRCISWRLQIGHAQ